MNVFALVPLCVHVYVVIRANTL